MHPAWNVAELILLIFKEVHSFDIKFKRRPRSITTHRWRRGQLKAPVPDMDAPESPLVVLARTCQAFHEPAPDILWWNLESLVPLFACMPPDVWKVENWNPPRV
ncbi:hypothetical protein DFH09DRAFT_470419 [Mycena vulgaris]|nr:hypothetical protein DFH09DRAFT_470419 [Mycena vulgaris]